MALEFRVNGTLLDPVRVRMTGGSQGGVAGLPSAAFNGEVATAGVQIEDPDGDLNLVGWKSFTVDETDCAKPRIFTGWIFSRNVSRGAYRTLAGRIWDCNIVDQNAAFGFKAFRASSAKRPAETDLERVAFGIDSAPMAANPVHDNGLVNLTDNPVTFGESNYVTQYPAELFGSVAGTSGKNFYAYYDDTANEISMYYDAIDATNRTSDLRISNVIADVDGDADTYYPMIDGQLERTPEETSSGVLLQYRGGLEYQQDAGTITDFIDRDHVHRTDRVGRAATAVSITTAMLAERDHEQDTITCMVRLPSSKVNLLHAGERVEVKFTHLPGWESFTFIRVVRRNVVPTAGRRDRYDVHLELSNRTPERGPAGRDPSVGSSGTLPGPSIIGSVIGGVENWGDAEDQAYISHRFNAANPGGVVEEAFFAGEVEPPVGFNSHDTPNPTTHADVGRYYLSHDAPVGATHARLRCDVIAERLEDGMVPETPFRIYHGNWGGTFPNAFGDIVALPPLLYDVVLEARWTVSMGGAEPYRRYPIDVNIPIDWFNGDRVQFVLSSGDDNTYDSPGLPAYGWYRCFLVAPGADPSTDADYYELTFYGPHASEGVVDLGTRISFVATAIGDGVATSFFTPYPYQAGSLVVTVNGVEQEVAETDPEVGNFTLAYAPAEGAVIRTSFVVAGFTETSVPIDETGGELGPTSAVSGTNIQDVGTANSAGTGAAYAIDSHVHEGVHSVKKTGSAALHGDVTLTAGTNVTLTQAGQDIEIASTGGGGSGGWDTVSTTGVSLEAGRQDIFDENLDAQIVMAGGIDLRTVGGEIWLLPDAGNVVTVDSGDGLILPRLASDPTAWDEGHIYYNTTSDIIRLRANGVWVDVGGGGASAWTTIVKSADEARVSSATVADDSELVVALSSNTDYAIRLMVFFQTNTTADLKYRIDFTGDGDRIRRRVRRTATTDTAQTIELKTTVDTSDVVLSTTGVNPWLEEDIIIHVGTTAGSLKLQWAQVTSNGGATTCLEGSYLEWAQT